MSEYGPKVKNAIEKIKEIMSNMGYYSNEGCYTFTDSWGSDTVYETIDEPLRKYISFGKTRLIWDSRGFNDGKQIHLWIFKKRTSAGCVGGNIVDEWVINDDIPYHEIANRIVELQKK